MGRQRIKKKKHKVPDPGLDGPGLTFVSYDIVFEALEESKKDIDPELANEHEEIYHSLREHPRECASRLAALIEKYPDYPVLYNHLYAAFRLMGEKEKARDFMLETYGKFPDYLFAKVGYAEFCLQEDKLDEIPAIFDNKYDLKLLYPDRTRFHITEFTAFAGTVGLYFCKTGKPEVARRYHEMLEKLAPDDPQTKRLEMALQASEVMAALKRLAGRSDE